MHLNTSASWATPPVHVWLCPHRQRQSSDDIVKPLIARHLACPPESVVLTRDGRGRPWLHCPVKGWDTNWSHSGEYLLLGLAHNGHIGVDIEQQRPRQHFLQLAERFFHASEVEMILAASQSEQLALFFRFWCAKEALLKACGRGVGFGLDRLIFTVTTAGLCLADCDPCLGQPSQWQFHEWMPLPGYRAALAFRAASHLTERQPDAD